MRSLSFIFIAVLAISSASAHYRKPVSTKQKMAVLAQVSLNQPLSHPFLA
jgi:hypothetical protein